VSIASAEWERAESAIRAARTILITTHCNPDGDGIGSQLALFHALTAIGKEVHLHNRDGLPRIYRFLPGSEAIAGGAHFPHCDLTIALDAGSRDRLGVDVDLLPSRPLLNIDHHISNSRYGSINLVDADYCSTGLVVHALLQRLHLPLTAAIASAIYTTLVTDTGNFRHGRIDADLFRTAAELVEAGAEPRAITAAIYENSATERLRLFALALTTLSIENGGRSSWMHVDAAMYAASGADVEETEGFIDYARAIHGVDITVFLRPDGPNGWRASFRSRNGINVERLASEFGGGGHRHAAGCSLSGTLTEVRTRLQTRISQLMEQ